MSGKGNGLGPGHVEINGESYATETFDWEGSRYIVRELSLDESDEAIDMATGPDGKTNDRLSTRAMLAKSLVEPSTGIEAIGKFGARKFSLVLAAFNRLNSLPVTNPTVPAGSAGATSPSGGEPSPQP